MKLLKILILSFLIISCKQENKEIIQLSKNASDFIVNEEYDKAMGAYDKIIKIDKEDYHAFIGKSIIFLIKKDYRNAENQIDIALKIKPDYAEAYLSKGLLNFKMNKNFKAIEYLKKSIELYRQRKTDGNYDDKNNDINIYYLYFFIGDKISKIEMKQIEDKYQNDSKTIKYFEIIKNHSKEELINKFLPQ